MAIFFLCILSDGLVNWDPENTEKMKGESICYPVWMLTNQTQQLQADKEGPRLCGWT